MKVIEFLSSSINAAVKWPNFWIPDIADNLTFSNLELGYIVSIPIFDTTGHDI